MTNYHQFQSVMRAHHADLAGRARTSPPQGWDAIEADDATATTMTQDKPTAGAARKRSVDTIVAFHDALAASTAHMDATTALTARIDSTLAYRWRLIAELKAHPEWVGTLWYNDRLNQLEASGRSLATLEDALLDEESRASGEGLPKDVYLKTVIARIMTHLATWRTLIGVANQADAVAELHGDKVLQTPQITASGAA